MPSERAGCAQVRVRARRTTRASPPRRAGQALWTLAYVEVPKLAEYKERIAFYFDDEVVELTFPAPYLNHHPTRSLIAHRRAHG